MRGEVAERVGEHLLDVAAALTGQCSDVDLDVHPIRDDVGLGAPVNDRGRKRGVRTRVGLPHQADRQLFAELVERVRVEEARVPVASEVDAFDEAPPRVMNHRGRPVLGETPHDLGSGDERVVGTERL